MIRELLGAVLEHHAGFGRSIQAGSLAQARRGLDARGNKFDLAAVDLYLLNGESFELLEKLCEAAPGV